MEKRQLPGLSRYLLWSHGEIESVRTGEYLHGGLDKDGYRKFVLIDDDGRRRYIRRASLICTAFHDERPTGAVVRHLDGSKENDAASNLVWATQAENMADKWGHGTDQTERRNGRTKLTREQVAYIRANPQKTYRALAKELGVTTGAIVGVRKGLTWAWSDDSLLPGRRRRHLPSGLSRRTAKPRRG